MSILTPDNAFSQLAPGSKFGNAFEDLLTAWQHQVLTPTQEPVEIAVTIPVVDLNNQAPSEVISRITLNAISATPFTVMPLWAKDGVTFYQFDNVKDPIRVEEDVAVIDVTPQEVTAVQLRFRKTGPDSEEDIGTGRQFATNFGFRQIAFWKMGHRRDGTLLSQVLTPQEEDFTIAKVSLTVDEVVPENTSIRYDIATAEAPTAFMPINPSNREDSEAPKVVDLATTQRSIREDNVFTVDSAPTSLGTIRGTEFFNLRTVTDPVLFPSARLWRGKNAWHCKRSTEVSIRSVRNLYLDFSNNDVAGLYVFEENERIANHPSNDGTSQIEIEVRYPILLESDEFQPGQDLFRPSDVTRPSYSVRNLLRRPVAGSVSSTQATGDIAVTSVSMTASQNNLAQQTSPTAGRSGATINLNNFSNAQLVRTPIDGTGAVPEVTGSEFRLSYTVNSVLLSAVFTVLSAQLETDGSLTMKLDDPDEILQTANGTLAALAASWEFLTLNITGSINNVVGDKLRLDRTQKVGVEDLLEVTYRRRLLAAESPITASLVIKNSSDNNTVYREGRDYSVDLGSRTISRTPTGSIGSSGDQSNQAVRVDFDFEEKLLGLVTYRTFVFNSQPTPKITIEQLQVDRENGEQILIETSQGFLDLHTREEIPALPQGWHQVVVRSNPVLAADGTVDTGSAIYKTVNLKEIRSIADTGRFLFPASEHPDATATVTDEFANYFTRQTAFLAPMQQTKWTQLTTGVRKTDRTVFAIKAADEGPATGTPVLVVNFDPQNSTDLLYFPPDLTGSGLPLRREDFEFEYSFTPTSVTTLTGLVLRARLKRSPDSEGSVTPILRNYTLRLSV